MELEDYRKFRGLTYDELAKQLDIERSRTYRICKKVYCCRLTDAYRIIDRTDGYVRMIDLLPEGC